MKRVRIRIREEESNKLAINSIAVLVLAIVLISGLINSYNAYNAYNARQVTNIQKIAQLDNQLNNNAVGELASSGIASSNGESGIQSGEVKSTSRSLGDFFSFKWMFAEWGSISYPSNVKCGTPPGTYGAGNYPPCPEFPNTISNCVYGYCFGCDYGWCEFACENGFSVCNGNIETQGCNINLKTDKNNCGTCGNVCPSGQTCSNGVCVSQQTSCSSNSQCPVLTVPVSGYEGWNCMDTCKFYTCSSGTCQIQTLINGVSCSVSCGYPSGVQPIYGVLSGTCQKGVCVETTTCANNCLKPATNTCNYYAENPFRRHTCPENQGSCVNGQCYWTVDTCTDGIYSCDPSCVDNILTHDDNWLNANCGSAGWDRKTCMCYSQQTCKTTDVCRESKNDCDVAEYYNTDCSCPADSFKSSVTSCDDENKCTLNDKCDGSGNCAAGDLKVCSSVSCAIGGTCNTLTGECSSAIPDNSKCADTDSCTVDVCNINSGCTNTKKTSIDCSAVSDGCCPTGCSYKNTDGNYDKDCVHCTTDSECDDGKSCTTDTCSNPGTASSSCVHTNVNSKCDDNNLCNGVETCDASNSKADSTTGCVGGINTPDDPVTKCTKTGSQTGANDGCCSLGYCGECKTETTCNNLLTLLPTGGFAQQCGSNNICCSSGEQCINGYCYSCGGWTKTTCGVNLCSGGTGTLEGYTADLKTSDKKFTGKVNIEGSVPKGSSVKVLSSGDNSNVINPSAVLSGNQIIVNGELTSETGSMIVQVSINGKITNIGVNVQLQEKSFLGKIFDAVKNTLFPSSASETPSISVSQADTGEESECQTDADCNDKCKKCVAESTCNPDKKTCQYKKPLDMNLGGKGGVLVEEGKSICCKTSEGSDALTYYKDKTTCKDLPPTSQTSCQWVLNPSQTSDYCNQYPSDCCCVADETSSASASESASASDISGSGNDGAVESSSTSTKTENTNSGTTTNPCEGPIIMDFYADWCGPCQAMKPTIKSLEESGYTIQKVDCTQANPLAQKHGVTSLPSFLIGYKINGVFKEIDRIVGGSTGTILGNKYNSVVAIIKNDPNCKAVTTPTTPTPVTPNPPIGSTTPPPLTPVSPSTITPSPWKCPDGSHLEKKKDPAKPCEIAPTPSIPSIPVQEKYNCNGTIYYLYYKIPSKSILGNLTELEKIYGVSTLSFDCSDSDNANIAQCKTGPFPMVLVFKSDSGNKPLDSVSGVDKITEAKLKEFAEKICKKVEISTTPVSQKQKTCSEMKTDLLNDIKSSNEFKNKLNNFQMCGMWTYDPKKDASNKDPNAAAYSIDCGSCGECNKCSYGFCIADLSNGQTSTSSQTVTPNDPIGSNVQPLITTPAQSCKTPQEMVSASVRIKVFDPKGSDTGSGTIIGQTTDNNGNTYAIILTCAHIFRLYQGGKITIEFFGNNNGKIISTPQASLGNGIYYDSSNNYNKDVALIKIKITGFGLNSLNIAKVAFGDVSQGEQVSYTGCDNGGSCQYGQTTVGSASSSQLWLNTPSVGGRSGGGLFNCDGEIVGVCNGYSGNQALYAGLGYVKEILNNNGLSSLINKQKMQGTLNSGSIFAATTAVAAGAAQTQFNCKKTTTSSVNDGCCGMKLVKDSSGQTINTGIGECGKCPEIQIPQKCENKNCNENVDKICNKYLDEKKKCKSSTAAYRTNNFIVNSNGDASCIYAWTLEYFRCKATVELLDKEYPNWAQPAVVSIQNGPHLGAGGATTFIFDRGEAYGWRMSIQGSYERLLDSVIPHEVQHMIVASYFREPLPRWADEGLASTTESVSEKNKHRLALDQFLRTGRGISFAQMFMMKEYPADIMPIYAQGFSVADYLLQLEESKNKCNGKKKFLNFLKEGLSGNPNAQGGTLKSWEDALIKNYGFKSLGDAQDQWLDWVKQGSPVFCKYT